jgi:predicted O-methyltransferase YrrM
VPEGLPRSQQLQLQGPRPNPREQPDAPIPISHEQVTTQPSLVARMVEALALEGNERVVEVGTGYGWQTALLSELADEVFSVERFGDLAQIASAALAGRANVHVVVGDGSQGLPEHAPFDAIRFRDRTKSLDLQAFKFPFASIFASRRRCLSRRGYRAWPAALRCTSS